jgi:hypothetical protein
MDITTFRWIEKEVIVENNCVIVVKIRGGVVFVVVDVCHFSGEPPKSRVYSLRTL